MVFSYQKNYLIVILIVPVLFVLSILQNRKTTFILQSLIVVLSVTYNGSRTEKIDGKPAGDQTMRLTTKLLKEIIKEELDNMTEEESPIIAVADAVGVPMEEEQIDEGFEALDYLSSLPPEQLEAIISYVVKMLGGGAAAIGGLVAADAVTDGGEKVDPRDDLYDDED